MNTEIKASREESDIEPSDKIKTEITLEEIAKNGIYDESTEAVLNSSKATNKNELQPLTTYSRMTKNDVMINRTNNYIFSELSFDNVNKYDFTIKSFIECIKSPDYVHLYFDIDSLPAGNKKKSVVKIIISEKSFNG